MSAFNDAESTPLIATPGRPGSDAHSTRGASHRIRREPAGVVPAPATVVRVVGRELLVPTAPAVVVVVSAVVLVLFLVSLPHAARTRVATPNTMSGMRTLNMARQ